MPAPQPAGRDRDITFTYKGNIISICTTGDTETILKDSCAYFSKMKYDIAISATRSQYHEPADVFCSSAGSPSEERYATCYYRVLCPAKALCLN